MPSPAASVANRACTCGSCRGRLVEISRLAAAPEFPFDPDLLRHVSPIEWKNVWPVAEGEGYSSMPRGSAPALGAGRIGRAAADRETVAIESHEIAQNDRGLRAGVESTPGAVGRCRSNDDPGRKAEGRGLGDGRRRAAELTVVAGGAEPLADGTGVRLRRVGPGAAGAVLLAVYPDCGAER